MSHEATNWAIKQRGIKPASKVVLWHLADRFHPDHGCFPSKETLSHDCEMSERSVYDQIVLLEKSGLLIVAKRGGKTASGKFTSNEYILGCDPRFSQHKAKPSANSAVGKSASKPSANSRENRRQILPSNPVREPVREPVNKKTNKKDFDDEFEFLWQSNPNKKGKDAAKRAWFKALKKSDYEAIAHGLSRYFKAWSAEGVDPYFMTTVTAWLNDEAWETNAHMPNRRQTTDDQLNKLMAPTTDSQLDNLFPVPDRKMIQ